MLLEWEGFALQEQNQKWQGRQTSAAVNGRSGEQSRLSRRPAADYSKTNIQVEGVDEADFVKNDGKYIYVIAQDKIGDR